MITGCLGILAAEICMHELNCCSKTKNSSYRFEDAMKTVKRRWSTRRNKYFAQLWWSSGFIRRMLSDRFSTVPPTVNQIILSTIRRPNIIISHQCFAPWTGQTYWSSNFGRGQINKTASIFNSGQLLCKVLLSQLTGFKWNLSDIAL